MHFTPLWQTIVKAVSFCCQFIKNKNIRWIRPSHIWVIVSLKRVFKKIDVRFLVNLIVYSGLQHLKLDFVSDCCHSDWNQNILFYLLFLYHDQLHKPVQLETQLKTAPWHTFLSLGWTIPALLTDRKKVSIRFANKKHSQLVLQSSWWWFYKMASQIAPRA